VELTQSLRIRALRGADTEFVLSLANAAFSEFSPEPARSTLWMAEHFVTLVAERGEVQLGFVVVRIERDHLAELVAIAVVERALEGRRDSGSSRRGARCHASHRRSQRGSAGAVHQARLSRAAPAATLLRGRVRRL